MTRLRSDTRPRSELRRGKPARQVGMASCVKRETSRNVRLCGIDPFPSAGSPDRSKEGLSWVSRVSG